MKSSVDGSWRRSSVRADATSGAVALALPWRSLSRGRIRQSSLSTDWALTKPHTFESKSWRLLLFLHRTCSPGMSGHSPRMERRNRARSPSQMSQPTPSRSTLPRSARNTSLGRGRRLPHLRHTAHTMKQFRPHWSKLPLLLVPD